MFCIIGMDIAIKIGYKPEIKATIIPDENVARRDIGWRANLSTAKEG
jgi:hypothetical protein